MNCNIEKLKDENILLRKQLEDSRNFDISKLSKKSPQTKQQTVTIESIAENINLVSTEAFNIRQQNYEVKEEDGFDDDVDISTSDAISDDDLLEDDMMHHIINDSINSNTMIEHQLEPKLQPKSQNKNQAKNIGKKTSNKFMVPTEWYSHFDKCLKKNEVDENNLPIKNDELYEKIWCLCGEQLKRPGNGDIDINDHRSFAAFKRHCDLETHKLYASTHNLPIPN